MTFKEFIKAVYESEGNATPWHIERPCEHIQAIENGERLIINPIRPYGRQIKMWSAETLDRFRAITEKLHTKINSEY